MRGTSLTRTHVFKFLDREMWKIAPKWLWLAVIVGSLTGWLFPFTFQRQEPWGEWFRAERPGLPLSPRERIYQLNTDQRGHWIPLIQEFPFLYSRQQLRINRPVYPGLVSALCRLSQGFQSLIIGNPRSGKTGCDYANAMASGFVLNWILFVWSTVTFYRVLLAWNVDIRIATLSAAHYALSPFILFHLLDVSTNLIAFPIAVAALWIFTRLAQRPDTGWDSQPLIYGLGLGALMLGKAQYDVLCVGWLALSYLRRWGAMFISFAAHLVPLLAWIGLIALFGLTYYNKEIAENGEGVWLIQEFVYWPLWDQFHYVAAHTVVYMFELLAAFGPVTLFFFIFGQCWLIAENMWKASALVGLALLINWLFILAIKMKGVLYVGEAFFVIYPVASLGVTIVARRFSVRIERLIMILYLASSVGLQWAYMYVDIYLFHDANSITGAFSVDIMALIRSLWTIRVELLSNLILMSAVMVLLMIWRSGGRNGVKAQTDNRNF
jgi:hypothetical protein